MLCVTAAYDYKTVLRDSLLFYEAQRSGKLPTDRKVTWRKDSALNDKGQKGEDLTGGYYDGKATHTLYTQIYIHNRQLNHTSHNFNCARIIWIVPNGKCWKNKGFSRHFSTKPLSESMGETEYRYYVNYWGGGADNLCTFQGQ